MTEAERELLDELREGGGTFEVKVEVVKANALRAIASGIDALVNAIENHTQAMRE